MGEFEIGLRSIVLYNKKILLVQRANVSWELPGGKLEFGENLHTALRREIKEETDLENICIEKLLYAVTFKINPEKQAIGLMYLSHAKSSKVKISNEHTDIIWVGKEQLITLLNNNMLKELRENIVLDSLEID